jgi:hypothetical protein
VALIAAYEGIALLAAALRDPGLIGPRGATGALDRLPGGFRSGGGPVMTAFSRTDDIPVRWDERTVLTTMPAYVRDTTSTSSGSWPTARPDGDPRYETAIHGYFIN